MELFLYSSMMTDVVDVQTLPHGTQNEGLREGRHTSVIVFLLASIQSHSLQNKNTKFINVNFKRGGVQILLVYHFHSFRAQSAHQYQAS